MVVKVGNRRHGVRATHRGPQARTRATHRGHTLHTTVERPSRSPVEIPQHPWSCAVRSWNVHGTCGPHAYLTVCLLGNGGFRRGRANAGRELLAFGLCEAGGRVGLLQDRVGGGRDVQARNGRTGGATCDAHGMYGVRERGECPMALWCRKDMGMDEGEGRGGWRRAHSRMRSSCRRLRHTTSSSH